MSSENTLSWKAAGWRHTRLPLCSGKETSCVEARAPHGSRRTSPPAPWSCPARSWPPPRPKRPPRPHRGHPGSHLARRPAHRRTGAQRPVRRFDDIGVTVDTALALDDGRRPRRDRDRHRRGHRDAAASPTSSTTTHVRRRDARPTPARLPRHSCSPRRPDPDRHDVRGHEPGHAARGRVTGCRAPIAGRIEDVTRRHFERRQRRSARPTRRTALARRPVPSEATAATSFLLQQQCPERRLPAGLHRRQDRCRPVLHGQHATAETDATAIAVLQLASQIPSTARRHRDHQGEGVAGHAAEGRRFLGRWPHHRRRPTPTAPASPPGHSVTRRSRRRRHSGCAHTRRPTTTRATSSADIGAIAYDDAGADRRPQRRHHGRRRRTSGAGPRRRRSLRWPTSRRTPPRPPRSSPDPAAT